MYVCVYIYIYIHTHTHTHTHTHDAVYLQLQCEIQIENMESTNHRGRVPMLKVKLGIKLSLLLPSLLWQPRCPPCIIHAHLASPPSCFFSPGIPPDRKWPAGPVLEARRGNQNHRQPGIPPFLLPLSPHTAQNFSPIPPIEATAGHIVGHSPE